MFVFHSCLLLAGLLALYPASQWLIDGLVRLARFLNWREFVVSFFVIALASSLPNFVVGLAAIRQGVPQLSFGDVTGNNMGAITLAVALAVFLSRRKVLVTNSRVTQITALFTTLAAVLPLLLAWDNTLSRGDGLMLLALFSLYVGWLFSKKENFSNNSSASRNNPVSGPRLGAIFANLGWMFLGLLLLLAAGQVVVVAASFFARSFDVPIIMLGFLVTGLGSALPEIYFAAVSAKREENWIILGNLMGSVIIPSTLVLGFVAVASPFDFHHLTSFASVRLWVAVPALLFIWFVRSERRITWWEAAILLIPYLGFISSQMFLVS